MRRAALALALPMLLVLAPVANAQLDTSFTPGFGGPAGATFVSLGNVPLHVQGQIVVTFHGDPAAGCAADGLCPYSGTIVVRPRSGDMVIATYRFHGRIGHFVTVGLQPGGMQFMTAARVERSIAGQAVGMCADAAPGLFGELASSTHGRSLRIGLFARGGGTLSTRCAGPLDGDLAGTGPSVAIPLKRALRGQMTLPLTGTGAFASHGFAGTVSSSLILRLGKPASNESGFPPGTKTQRMRVVTEQLNLVGVGAQLSATVHGSPNPVVCQVLDSCALVGTLGFGPRAQAFSAEVSATGTAARPYRDFLAALGLSRSGQPRGIAVELSGSWTLSPVTVDESQSGACTGSAPGGDMFFGMTAGRAVLRGSGGLAGWRTRCPGPTPSEATLFPETVPVSSLGHRELTITLRPAGTVEDDGYTVSLHGHLTLTLRRGRITQHVFRQPVG